MQLRITQNSGLAQCSNTEHCTMQHCGVHLCPQESWVRTPFCLVSFHFWLQYRYGDVQSKYPHFSRLSSHCGNSQLGSLGVEANVASWLPPHWFCLTDSGATSFRPESNLVRQCSKPVSPTRASLAVRFLRHEIEKDAAPKDIKPPHQLCCTQSCGICTIKTKIILSTLSIVSMVEAWSLHSLKCGTY